MEGSRSSKILWMLLYALATGIVLALFTLIDGMIKYLFSLAGLFFVFKYFKRGETLGYRIGFIVLSLITFVLFIVIFVTYNYMKDNGLA